MPERHAWAPCLSAMPGRLVDVGRTEKAAACVNPVLRDTPRYWAEPLGDALGLRALLKVKTVNPIRCFKRRGTDLLAQGRPRGDVLVCAAAGNLGQGLAHVGREHGLPTHVFAASTVNLGKLAAMRRLGAQVHLVDGGFDTARRSAAETADRNGWTSATRMWRTRAGCGRRAARRAACRAGGLSRIRGVRPADPADPAGPARPGGPAALAAQAADRRVRRTASLPRRDRRWVRSW
ncbi:pyridoxal-phosphate dependent enzyme [Streptomyces sp. NBC_01136]|uniref:pyridoxal-phosphate dependent enzyme n=1 Tax=Streptomyces sp. NBC_01136 TaxID=2903754 RepID=UPI0038650681